ncbi:MAG TPA: hypothetical protein VK191_13525 [Symbiobacteriaceae bacterium]|nr:hypothetical protein [Symbiobacteriaceae bacterium]
MIELHDGRQPNRLVINWEREASGCIELIIAPAEEPFTVNSSGVAIWSNPDNIGGVVVERSALVAGLEEVTTETVVDLPVFPRCQSQLKLVATDSPGMAKMQIMELYDPVLGLTYTVDSVELLDRLSFA